MFNLKKHILCVTCGKDPAAVTKSIYALAKEKPKIIPDEVIVFISSENRKHLVNELFEKGKWQDLKTSLKISERTLHFNDSDKFIKVVPDIKLSGLKKNRLSDHSETTAIADLITKTLKLYTEQPDNSIIFTIAEDGKMMNAVIALCMTSLGRQQDRLCVLHVNPPFDNFQLEPKFYFPEKTVKCHRLPDNSEHYSENAHIWLGEIPFARNRYLLQDQFNRLPENFIDLVELSNTRIIRHVEARELCLYPDTLKCLVDTTEFYLTPMEFTVYWLLATRCKNEIGMIKSYTELFEEFKAFANTTSSTVMPEIILHNRFKGKRTSDVKKTVSSLRKKIIKNIHYDQGLDFCLPNRGKNFFGLSLPPDKVVCPRNY